MNITLIYQRSYEGSKFTPRCYSKNGQRKGRDGNHFFSQNQIFRENVVVQKKNEQNKKIRFKILQTQLKKSFFSEQTICETKFLINDPFLLNKQFFRCFEQIYEKIRFLLNDRFYQVRKRTK